MRLISLVVLFAVFIIFAKDTSAQSAMVSDEEAPVLTLPQPSDSVPNAFEQQPQPAPPSEAAQQTEVAMPDVRTAEDLYRAEIKTLGQNKNQFVHCKLKNGRVLTGTVRGPGYEAFMLHTNAVGQGTYIYYKDLAEAPRAVPAVGTHFKHAAQWTGIGALIVIGLPILILLSAALFASGERC